MPGTNDLRPVHLRHQYPAGGYRARTRRLRMALAPIRIRERPRHRPLQVTIPECVDLTAWSPYRLGSVQQSLSARTGSVRPPVTVGRLHIQPLLATVAGAEAVLLAVLSARSGWVQVRGLPG